MYVCLCHGISDKKLQKMAIEEGIADIRQVRKILPLGSQCGKCIRPAKEILQQASSAALYKQAC